ncbi:MAG: hypothetical protein JXR69_11355 [Candidatus Delongbacteria bacterium]|nr:hypothetical protein [Candidatus Delongbacteria bacterium]
MSRRSALFIFITSLLFSETWELKKSTDYYKAYTKGDRTKTYRIESNFSLNPDEIFNFLTSFDKFHKIYNNIESIEILYKNDSTVIHYSVMDSPWPVSNRDLITRIDFKKVDGTYIMKSCAADEMNIPVKNDLVRISEFNEKIIIRPDGSNRSELIIEGKIGFGGNIPQWLQSAALLSGPITTMDKLKEISRR